MNSRLYKQKHFTMLIRNTMETSAWRGLSSTAQALYPWIKLQWKGKEYNNNGKIQLSNRQAAECLGVTIDTASRAFHNLQEKGFLHVTEGARLGLGGNAKSPSYELTEVAMPGKGIAPRKLYLDWYDSNDFPIYKAMANNPTGRNGQVESSAKIINFNSKSSKDR